MQLRMAWQPPFEIDLQKQGTYAYITIILQDYDADGKYVRAWIPELANVPKEKVHAPFSMTKEEQSQSGVTIGRDYPYPPKSSYDRSGEGKRFSSSLCL